MLFEVRFLFSIVALTIRAPRIDQEEDSYSVVYQIDTNCTYKSQPTITLDFRSTVEKSNKCIVPFQRIITCENFTYGVNYSITGYFQCGRYHATLAGIRNLYEVTKPEYINSRSTPTSIDTVFFLAGLFSWLYVGVKSVNQICWIPYSPTTSPFYNCSFRNLPPAESFNLTYLVYTENNDRFYGDPKIIYTELEELNLSCQFNETNRQIAFYWSSLPSSGYSNLIISLQDGNKKTLVNISCNPYRSQGICSTEQYQLKPGTEYQITAKLEKVFPNYTAVKSGICSIKTNLSLIPVDTIQHQFLNKRTVRINWFEHPFAVQARLINLETHSFEYPIKHNNSNALFVNLAEGSIYQVELNISKPNYPSINQTMYYFIRTELEDLNLSCQFNKTHQRITFAWSNLTSSGYSNLTISLKDGNNKSLMNIACDPYLSQGTCSMISDKFEADTEYRITAKLEKVLTNFTAERNGTCSIKINKENFSLSSSVISVNSIRHEVINETMIRLNWLKHPFFVQVRLRNVERDSVEDPIENNQTNALFLVREASIYQVEFDIFKGNSSSILQMTNYLIQTNLKKFILKNVVRLSENSLLIDIDQINSSKIEVIYCISKILENNSQICSKSNRFDELSSSTIYNVSVSIRRDSFDNRFFWKQTVFKLVHTDISLSNISSWKTNETCGVKLFTNSPYSMECISNRTMFNCNKLRCGCQYQLKIRFNRTIVRALCSSSPCDNQLFNNSNFINIKIQTPLQSVENLRIVSVSPISREIQVEFAKPKGCFDRLILICENISSKERKIFPNSTICNDLLLNESYRISVQTERDGWNTEHSNSIEIQFILNSTLNSITTKGSSTILWVVIPCLAGIFFILLFSGLIVFLFVYRRHHRFRKQSTTNKNADEPIYLTANDLAIEDRTMRLPKTNTNIF